MLVSLYRGADVYWEVCCPTITFGAVGDYYLDVTNGQLSTVPRTSTGWAEHTRLQGPQGLRELQELPEQRAARFTTATALLFQPALGTVSEIITFDINKLLFFTGPKSATGWGTLPSTLSGPAGLTGACRGPQVTRQEEAPPMFTQTLFTITGQRLAVELAIYL